MGRCQACACREARGKLAALTEAAAGAQVPRRMIGTDAFQETPIVEVTRQITKHNYLVMDIRDLPRIIKEARAQPHAPAPMPSRGRSRAR